MTTEELLNYILSNIQPITNKYKSVCHIGSDQYCIDDKTQWKLGSGCCYKCNHHSSKGCTITNLCCICYFCDSVKDKIEPNDWIKLKSILILLQSFGLQPRQSWEYQIILIDSKKVLYNITNEDLYHIFKCIING